MGPSGILESGSFERRSTLITFEREAIEMSGQRRYRSGCFAYSIEEEGEMSSRPDRSFRLSSDGVPETKRTSSSEKWVVRAWKIGTRFA
jgi:hypothetical protein